LAAERIPLRLAEMMRNIKAYEFKS
jgi:hypothetical protein